MAKSRNRKLADLIVTAGVDIAGNVTFDGGSTSADLTFADGDKANFGDASDLKLYHTANHSYIENGTGSLFIDAAQVNILDGASTAAAFTAAGATTLYNNGSPKLATTSTGINVTGITTSDTLVLEGTGVNTTYFTGGDASVAGRQLTLSSEAAGGQNNATHRLTVPSGYGSFNVTVNGKERLKVNNNGDVSFYNDASSNAVKMFWDASSERLAIGTTNPSTDLHLKNAASTQLLLESGNTDTGFLLFGDAQDLNVGSVSYSHSENSMRFETSDTERMRIDSSGNVGIGTTSPTESLSVEGGGAISGKLAVGSTTTHGSFHFYNQNNAYFNGAVTIDDALSITGSNAALSVTGTVTSTGASGGNLFLTSTDTSGATGEVLGNINFVSSDASTGSSGTMAKIASLFDSNGDNAAIKIQTGFSTGSGSPTLRDRALFASNGDISFYEDTGSAAKFFWDASGEVLGIGTSAPNTKLHVNNTSQGNFVEALRIENSGGGADEGAYINWEVANTAGHGARIGGRREGTGGIGLHFYTGEISSAPTERMRISHDGKVGIGTSSPTAQLDVRRGDASGKIAEFHNNVGYGVDIGSSTAVAYISSGYNQRLDFKTDPTSGQTERMSILANGKVGIGTTDPQKYLHMQHGSTNVFTPSNDSWHSVIVHNNASAATNTAGIAFEVSGSAYHGNAGTGIAAVKNGTNSDYGADLVFITRPQNAVAEERMRITDDGKVGIGNTSPGSMYDPYSNLVIGDTGNSGITIKTSNGVGSLVFADGTSGDERYRGIISYHHSSDTLKINTAGTLAMSIDSNHNVLIGTTNTNMATASGSQSGTQITDGGIAIAANNPVAQFNRVTDDGAIVNFRKDGAVVGSIGVAASDNIYFAGGSGSTKGIYINNAAVYPANTGGDVIDNAVALGQSGIRWTDLYLSGGAYLGGTGSANKLDDYEEGDYDCTVTCSTSGTVTLNTSYNRVGYTKVGRLVTVHGFVVVSSVSSPVGYFKISLPFTPINLTNRAGDAAASVVMNNVASANIADFVGTVAEGDAVIYVQLGDASSLQNDSAQQLQANTYISFSATYSAA